MAGSCGSSEPDSEYAVLLNAAKSSILRARRRLSVWRADGTELRQNSLSPERPKLQKMMKTSSIYNNFKNW